MSQSLRIQMLLWGASIGERKVEQTLRGDQCLRDLACDEAGFADVGEEMVLVVSRRVWMKARVWEWLMRS